MRRPVEQCGAFPAVRSAIVHLGKMDLLGRRLSLQATPAGSGYCACGLPQTHKVCDASQRDSLSLGKSRAVDGAGADLGRSAPRVMYGPRFATPGAVKLSKNWRKAGDSNAYVPEDTGLASQWDTSYPSLPGNKL